MAILLHILFSIYYAKYSVKKIFFCDYSGGSLSPPSSLLATDRSKAVVLV